MRKRGTPRGVPFLLRYLSAGNRYAVQDVYYPGENLFTGRVVHWQQAPHVPAHFR